MARKLAGTHGLGDDDVIVDRLCLEELQGALYCLQAAVEDVDRDLAGEHDATDVADALRWLLDNARPLVELWIEPRTTAAEHDVAVTASSGRPHWNATSDPTYFT